MSQAIVIREEIDQAIAIVTTAMVLISEPSDRAAARKWANCPAHASEKAGTIASTLVFRGGMIAREAGTGPEIERTEALVNGAEKGALNVMSGAAEASSATS